MASPQVEDGTVRIATELFEAECRVKMSGSEWQVYRFIQRKTYGWKKRRDAIGYGQFVTGTGLDRRRVIEAVKSLENRRMLVVTKNGLGKPNVYEIQKNYKKWVVVTKSALVTKNGKSSDKKRLGVVTKSAPTIATNTKTKTIANNTVLPDWLNPETWGHFVNHRKGMKSTMSAQAQKLLIGKLTKLRVEGHDPEELLNTAIMNGWKSVYPQKPEQKPIGSKRNERIRREIERAGNESTGNNCGNVPALVDSEKIRRH